MREYPRRKRSSERSVLAAMDDEVGKPGTNNEVTISSSSKRRKFDDSELLLNSAENSITATSASPANSTTSSSLLLFTSHEDLRNVKKENMRSTDLKHKDSATGIRSVNICQFSKETSPATSELCGGDSVEFMEESSSTTAPKISSSPKNFHRKPSAAEIEEFFSAAENNEQKRFAEKYNYDIVKDVPLEGQYQWIRLKP